MKQTVIQFMKRHALIHKEATVLVGVSGGPDSMALLHLYKQLTRDWDIRVIALSVDHQLRGHEGAADVAFVKEQCDAWGIPFVETKVDVATYKEKEKVSTQVAARTLRYHFFTEQMRTYEADYLALGHHGDDQVETMAMGFVHQTSPRAAAGIPVKRPFSNGSIARPLLCVTKEMVYDYCEAYDIPYRIDPSNEDDTYERNYFRKHIVPLFVEQNPNVQTTMQHMSERLMDDEHYMEAEAKKVVKDIVSFSPTNKKVVIRNDRFLSFPIALQRRAFHLLLNYLYDQKEEGLTYAHEQAFFALCHNEKAHVQVDLPNGLTIAKVYEDIHFSAEEKRSASPYIFELPVPGEIMLPDGAKISTSFTKTPSKAGKHTYICQLEEVHLPLYVRTRKEGDRLSWKGLQGTKKLKDLFIDTKIPQHERSTWPLVTDRTDRILWVVGIRKAWINEEIPDEHTYIVIRYQAAIKGGEEERA